MSLLGSLEELTGKQVYRTLDHVDLGDRGSDELDAYYDRDGHPSLLGHEFYAGVVSEILLSDGLIP
jgi:hypothetical protein